MVVSRLHAALINLSPGGTSKELNASDAMRLLNDFDPVTPVEQIQYDLAHELLDDVRLDAQLKVSHKRIKDAVRAPGTSLTDLYGVGPILAGALIGYTGDVRRFSNRDQFASYEGVAPIEHSSGGRVVHRLSHRGMVPGRFLLALVAMLHSLRRVEHLWSTPGTVPASKSRYRL